MSFNFKNQLLALGLIAGFAMTGMAYAGNPFEQISQGSDKLQQRGHERMHEEKNNHHERHGHSGQEDRNDRNSAKSCANEQSLRSTQGSVNTSVKFINNSKQEVRIYWLDYNGRRVFYKAIPTNGQYTQPTFQTHPWVITDSRDICMQVYVSSQPSATVNIR
jgi:VHL beta domain